jgi:sugar phosphate isomerase/epimerase
VSNDLSPMKKLDIAPRVCFLIYMQMGISTCYNYDIALAENLKAISEAGFKFVSLGGRVSHSGYNKPEGREKILKFLSENNLTLDSVHAPFDPTCDLSQLEDIFAQGALIELKRAITATAELGVPILIVHLTSFKPSRIAERIQAVKKNLPQLVQFAESSNVIIALENLDQDSEVLFKFALDMIDSGNLKFCYDNGHEMLYNGSMDILKTYGDRLVAIHFHDNDGKKDLHQVPFEGKLNLPSLASQLNKFEKIPDLTLECEMRFSQYHSSADFLKGSYDNGLKFLEMLKH